MNGKWFRGNLILALICGVLTSALPACAQQNPNYTSDDWLNARYDWVLYLTPKVLPNYLKYPNSHLYPIVDVAIDYRIAPRCVKGIPPNRVHYEHLWCYEGRAIGCRRFCKLPIKDGWQGAIVVENTDDAASNPDAIASAIVRSMLDASLLDCSLVVVLAPQVQESAICDSLGRFQFYRTEDMSVGSTATVVHLFVSSGDISDRTFLIYKTGK